MSHLLRVTGTVVNVRSAPTTNSSVVTQVKADSLLEPRPVASEGPWLAVWTAEGKPGWVHGAYVTAATPAKPTPAPRKPKWRVAKSLDALLAQLNERAPKRSKKHDGSIGDTAHAARKSEHNPDAKGVVRARDYTHDPANGLDAGKVTEAIRRSRDRRTLYIIFNGRIAKAYTDKRTGAAPFVWQAYTGPNPHAHHFHLSVVEDPALYDDVRPWAI